MGCLYLRIDDVVAESQMLVAEVDLEFSVFAAVFVVFVLHLDFVHFVCIVDADLQDFVLRLLLLAL